MKMIVRTVLAAGLLLAPGIAWSQDATVTATGVYEPVAGDQVVVYTHRFHPEDYAAGRDIVLVGFAAAMEAHGDKRRTYFLENEAEAEVVAVSFFHRESSVAAWQESMARADVLKQLEPLRREPLIVKQYVLGLHHHVPGGQ